MNILKQDHKIKERMRREETWENKVHQEESRYLGCARLLENEVLNKNQFCMDDMLKVIESSATKNIVKASEKSEQQNDRELGGLLKTIMIDVYASNQLYMKIFIFELVTMLVSLTSIVASVIAYEYTFPVNPKDGIDFSYFTKDNARSILLVTYINNSSLTILMITTLYYRYVTQIEFDIFNKIYNKNETLWTTKLWKMLMVEVFFSLPHPNVFFVNSYFEYTYAGSTKTAVLTYYANDFFIVFMLTRVYYIVRFVFVISYYKTSRAARICKIYGETATDLFAFRSLFNKNPFAFFSAMFVSVVLTFAFGIRVFERVFKSILCDTQDLSEITDFNPFINSLWFVMVTVLTIGYGDFTPKSLFGRLLGLVLIFFGLLTNSLVTVVFFRSLEFTPNEVKVFMLLERLKLREDVNKIEREISSLAFRNFRHGWILKRNPNIQNREELEDDKKKNRIQMNFLFRKKRKIKKKIEHISSANYIMESVLDDIQNILTNLSHNVTKFNSLSRKLNEINNTDREMIKHIKRNVETRRRRQNNVFKRKMTNNNSFILG